MSPLGAAFPDIPYDAIRSLQDAIKDCGEARGIDQGQGCGAGREHYYETGHQAQVKGGLPAALGDN